MKLFRIVRIILVCVLSDVATLQIQYQDLVDHGKLTKSSICAIIMPFCEKYCLSGV